jgi:hypothetical protein
MSRTTDDDETIRKHSGWLIPLGVFLVTAALSAMILLIYLAPSAPSLFEEQVSPTSRGDIVTLNVNARRFFIPANYLQFESTRQGGKHREIAIFALLPEMSGWSNWEAQTFTGNAPDSPVVNMLIREDKLNLSERDKLQRVYMDYITNPRGAPGQFDLTQYTFRGDTGYHNQDLFVGETQKGPLLMLCERLGPDVASPNCLRDVSIAHGVSMNYRFKRAHLSKWREIGENIDKLIAMFEKAPK